MTGIYLEYLPINQAYIFMFNDDWLRLHGEPLLFSNREDAIRAANKIGFCVNSEGEVYVVPTVIYTPGTAIK